MENETMKTKLPQRGTRCSDVLTVRPLGSLLIGDHYLCTYLCASY